MGPKKKTVRRVGLVIPVKWGLPQMVGFPNNHWVFLPKNDQFGVFFDPGDTPIHFQQIDRAAGFFCPPICNDPVRVVLASYFC